MMNDDSEDYFIARYTVGVCETEELINYANSKLSSGIYSDVLLDIIDASPRCWEVVSPIFEKLIVHIPSFEDSIKLIIKYHLKLIASEKFDPFIQFKQLLHDIENFDLHKNITKYVGDNIGLERLYGLYYARDNLDIYENGITEIVSQMREESRKWLLEVYNECDNNS